MSFAAVATVAAVGTVGSSIYGAHQAGKAAKQQAAAADRASDMTKEMYDQTRTDLQPYTQAGTTSLSQLLQAMGQGGSLNKNYQSTPFNFAASPDYTFRKQQGLDGLQSQAAAQGGLLSGATLKALNSYNSNLASEEYGNAFNRWQSNDTNQYNRFTADQNNQFSRLYNLVNMGQSSAAQVGNAGAAAAQQIGQNTMAGADARAAGMIGQANAISGGIDGLLGVAGAYQKFKTPTGVV